MRTIDRPVTVQRINEVTETWEELYKIHASINKTRKDSKYLSAGAIQGKKTLTFEVRYFADLEDISYNLQSYRIMYQGIPFNIVDYDDYMLKHKTVKILGVSY